MSTEAVWTATKKLADAWAATPRIEELNKLVPSSLPFTTPLCRFLQELDAGGVGVSARPLALATQASIGLSMPPDEPHGVDRTEFDAFFDLVERVEAAHTATVAWIRSRIPGYPMINTPQLGRGTALTTEEYTHRYPWSRSDWASGLQYHDRVRGVGDVLGIPGDTDIADLTFELSRAFAGTEEWLTFAAARSSLTQADEQTLKDARTDLQARLAPDAVDAYEPRLALRRQEFREHHTEAVVDALEGGAGDFARAFNAVNDVVDLVAVDVFAQFVRVREPMTVEPQHLEFDGSSPDRVTADVPDDARTMFLKPGQLAQFIHPLVNDLVRVDGVGMSFNEDRARMRLQGRILSGTAILLTDWVSDR